MNKRQKKKAFKKQYGVNPKEASKILTVFAKKVAKAFITLFNKVHRILAKLAYKILLTYCKSYAKTGECKGCTFEGKCIVK